MKFIEITFPNNEKWRIPAQVVAESRAAWHNSGETYQQAVDYALSNDAELVNYLHYVMDWTEVMRSARLAGSQFLALYDYAEAFDEATFKVKGE